MPPSPDSDSINTPSSSPHSQPGRLTQKGSGAGGHSTTKSKKRNGAAKDTGSNGILAAVTKNAAKMSTKNTKSSATTPTESPEIEPEEALPNGNPVTSPLLDALSSATIVRSSTHNTNEWADNVPAYSSSPNNLINLGDSPPNLPSSYEERVTASGWPAREQRTVANAHLASASPPANRRRPLSYHIDGASGQVLDDHRSQVSSYAARRSSMYAQHPRYAQHPPLPHQAQAHFYGAPDAHLLLSPPGPGLIPGENGYYCGFDSLPTSQDASRSADKVIVTGYEGGITVHTVTKRGLKKSASLEGLRGGVYNAKILPWNILGRTSQHFPLVAVVIHGLVLTAGNSPSGSEAGQSPDGISTTHNGSVRGSPRATGPTAHENGSTECYQTTVEVYSLSTKQKVATLLSIPKTHSSIPSTSPLFKPPPPAGALTIHADEGSVVVASGTTGETWIFRQKVTATGTLGEFGCIGKVWTTVQHGVSVETPGLSGLADGDWYSTDSGEERQYKASILSLRGRWLAYCPSTPSSQVSLRATIPGISSMKIPGLAAQASPQLPSVNCAVETPEGESMVKQIMQAGTQALIEGTTYIGKQIGKQGAQAWNNYWNKPPASQEATGGMAYHTPPNAAHQFPPTHAAPSQAPAVAKDPGLVSILDLESLARHNSYSNPPHPLSTFKIPHGCSFLSFAPSGLALFTASSKGDIQCVWDLMRVHFAKSSFLKAGSQGSESRGPHIRQIAQFSRMTIARIVDVAWSSPHGERAAMVTEPGTVHILDLPASAFTWPPPRRRITPMKSEDATGDGIGTGHTPASVATNAVNSLWTAALPLVSRRRRSSAGMSAKTMTAQAGHGTQILAAGISRSVGAATGRMNEMRKSGNAKLHLPRSGNIPSKSCVLLLNRKRSDSIVVVGGGIIRFYTIKNRRADRPADKQKASRGAKYVEFRLPSLPDFKITPGHIRAVEGVGGFEDTQGDTEVLGWNPRIPSQAIRQHGTESSIPQAEIESTAPYQPFHSDRRVSLHVYSSVSDITSSASSLRSPPTNMKKLASAPVSGGRIPWAFGGAIKTTKLDVGPVHVADDDLDISVDHRALPTSAIERILMVKDNDNDMEQIVVTTRRRKGISRSGTEAEDADEEGFFEDDCEVLDFASQRV